MTYGSSVTSKRCEYVGGPRDGDRVCIPVDLGARVTLQDGIYQVENRSGEFIAKWYGFDGDAIDPLEGEEWKQ